MDCTNCDKEIKEKFIVVFPDGYLEFCSKKCAKESIIANIDSLIHPYHSDYPDRKKW